MFYKDNTGVEVTDRRVVLRNGSLTYAVANITSVSTRIEEPSRTGPVLLLLVGLVALATRTPFGIILGIALLIMGFFWWRGLKPIWHLRIASASGETSPLQGDQQYISGVAQAISRAMVHRA